MGRWYRLVLLVMILPVVWGCAAGSPLEGKGQVATVVTPAPRFTQADNGVITDRDTGLEWFAGPNPDNTFSQAKAWVESLTVAGGGWRLPTIQELEGIYQKDASAVNLDRSFKVGGAWIWSGELHNDWSVWGLAIYNGLRGWHAMDYGNGRIALAVRSGK
jgi:hypothetical protein